MEKEEFLEKVKASVVLKDRIDSLTSTQSELRGQIKAGLLELGEEDDKGHIIVEVDDNTVGVKRVIHQRKVSKNLDIEIAQKILEERGLAERCIMQVPVLDEQEIMAAYYDGEITEEDIDKMFPAKVTWALVMK